MENDKYGPGMFRVLGTLQNSNEFSKAWNCPVGSKMNPAPSDHEKCTFFETTYRIIFLKIVNSNITLLLLFKF